jgi:phenylalanyl-tRNA synthetase alpha chain
MFNRSAIGTRPQSGVVTRIEGHATAPADERRERGAQANHFKRYVEQRLAEAEAVRGTDARGGGAESDRRHPAEPRAALGHRHPLTIIRDQLEDIFTRMGFAVVEGPEVEDEWHCFDR